MLFNSHEFFLVFLPLFFVLFWYGGRSLRWRLGLLTTASYVFYSWWQFDSWTDVLLTLRIGSLGDLAYSLWKWRFTLVMLLSSTVDYWAARWIVRTPAEKSGRRKLLLGLSLAANLGLLGFFKYFGFFEKIVSDLIELAHGGALPIVSMALPVGISFYTFESMSYVIDIYRGVAKPAKSYLDYACFISFFPHLVGWPDHPLLRHPPPVPRHQLGARGPTGSRSTRDCSSSRSGWRRSSWWPTSLPGRSRRSGTASAEGMSWD